MTKVNWKALRWTCFFPYVDKFGRTVRGKGRTMRVDGVELHLFPSSVLCGALHRDMRCLYSWERKFGFPRALWKIRDDHVRQRWYSAKQIAAVLLIYEKFGRLKKENRSQLHKFIKAVSDVFYLIDFPVMEREKP